MRLGIGMPNCPARAPIVKGASVSSTFGGGAGGSDADRGNSVATTETLAERKGFEPLIRL